MPHCFAQWRGSAWVSGDLVAVGGVSKTGALPRSTRLEGSFKYSSLPSTSKSSDYDARENSSKPIRTTVKVPER